MTDFTDKLDTEQREVFAQLRAIVLQQDSTVTEKSGAIMSSKNAIVYLEQGVFKYGFSQAKKHFSFHSMVMYANPHIAELTKASLQGIKMQKGCVNFNAPEVLEQTDFAKILAASAECDFSPVIAHYKNKATRK